MIEIGQTDTTATVTLKGSYPINDWTFDFTRECGGEVKAILLARALQNAMRKAIERTRRREYKRGYQDCRGHHKMATAFDCTLEE